MTDLEKDILDEVVQKAQEMRQQLANKSMPKKDYIKRCGLITFLESIEQSQWCYNGLKTPKRFPPCSFAVDPSGKCLVAEGGDYQKGAKKWTPFSLLSYDKRRIALIILQVALKPAKDASQRHF